MVITLKLFVTENGLVVASAASRKSITYGGYEFIIRSVGDPTTRPAVISALGIGWGAGANTDFDPNQTGLQGTSTSYKTATFVYQPSQDRLSCKFQAMWGVNDPSTQDILIEEIGLFSGTTLIDRTRITPTLKRANQEAVVHGVFKPVQSESEFSLL